MRESSKEVVGHAGLRCWKCGGHRFRVSYTRAAPGGKIIRRRVRRAGGGSWTRPGGPTERHAGS